MGTPARQPVSKSTETKCDLCHCSNWNLWKARKIYCSAKELVQCGFIAILRWCASESLQGPG